MTKQESVTREPADISAVFQPLVGKQGTEAMYRKTSRSTPAVERAQQHERTNIDRAHTAVAYSLS